MKTPNPSETITIIEPKPGWIALDFKEIWKYRELFYFLTKRDIKESVGDDLLIIQSINMLDDLHDCRLKEWRAAGREGPKPTKQGLALEMVEDFLRKHKLLK